MDIDGQNGTSGLQEISIIGIVPDVVHRRVGNGKGIFMQFIVNKDDLTRQQAEDLLLRPRDYISIDVETVSLDNLLVLGIAIGVEENLGFYFFDTQHELLKKVIAQTPKIIGHNIKFDLPLLVKLGYYPLDYEDTKMIAYSAGILENSLESLSSSILGKDCPSVTSQWKKKDQGNIAIDHVKMGEISIIHACNTLALWERLPKTPLYYEVDKPSLALIMEMEKWGLLIDQYKLTQVEQESIVRTNGIEQELKEELGDINLASNPQVTVALQAKGILGTRKTKAGKDSVSEESLRPLNHPIANKLLNWKSEMKTLTTYVPAFRNVDSEGRIHTRFGFTSTGRWSSSRPNLQNITRNDLRKCIVAEDTYTFVSLDANQIELRVLAVLSQDPRMLEDLKTGDIHLATAIRMFGWTDDKEEMSVRRYKGKQGNFADIYGATPEKLAELLECSYQEALEFQRERQRVYPVLHKWIMGIKTQAKEDGFVTNLFGRIRPIPELQSGSWKLIEKAEREAVNMIIQGTASDLVKKMMLYLKEIISEEVRFTLQVHDEILFECPDGLVVELLEQARELELAFPDYPCSVSVGKVYGEMEKL